MRADVCLHRNAAALAAAEDDGVPEPTMAAGGSAGRGGMLPTPLAALFAPVAAHTQLSDERIRFDPVPVYIGPAPGWKGPALGARRTASGTAAAPGGAETAEKANTVAGTAEGDASRSQRAIQIQAQACVAFQEEDSGAQTRAQTCEERDRKIGEEGRIHQLNCRSVRESAILMTKDFNSL